MTTLSSIKIGDKINSANGRYYHIVQSIGKIKEIGLGDRIISVKTKSFSNTGRFVQNETIVFKSAEKSEFKTNHIN